MTSPGNPIPPGDTLFMDGQGSVVNVIHTTFNNGSVLTQEHQVVSYISWETLRITNSPTNSFEADAFSGGSLYSSAPAGSITASNRTTAPSGVAVGDLNGDGVPDMAVSNSKTVNNVTVFLGKGDGTFGTTPGVDFFNFSSGGANPATNKPSDIAIADITGDGKPDLIVVNIGTKTIAVIPNTIAAFPGNPVGTPVSFGTATVTGKLKFVPRALTVGNVTGDAGLDVVVANPSPGNVAIFTNVAGALPAAPSLTLNPGGAGTSDVTIGDYNKDGLNDIAAVNKAANSVTNSISLFLATGPGVIPTTPTLGLKRSDLGLQGLRPASLTTSDFNGDGIDDIAVTDQLSRSITTLLGNTNTVRPVVPFTFKAMLFTSLPKSAFATSIGSGLPGSAGSLILGDFNSDGKQDIAITPSIGGELRVLLGTGVGDFSQPYVFDLGNWASRVVSNVVITDLNNDGAPDIVLANYTTSNVGVLLRKV